MKIRPNRHRAALESGRYRQRHVSSLFHHGSGKELSCEFQHDRDQQAPSGKDLVSLLKEWLQFRTVTVRRRLQFRLDKILDRLHILDGLLIAFLNIDEVIKIIRQEDKPKQAMMKAFKISERQSEASLSCACDSWPSLRRLKLKPSSES